jgi:hypothetical protein
VRQSVGGLELAAAIGASSLDGVSDRHPKRHIGRDCTAAIRQMVNSGETVCDTGGIFWLTF